jgi:hypothetical protein
MEAKPPQRPKGYEDTAIYQFTGISNLRERVQSLAHELAAGHTTKQHLIFWNVTKNHLAQFDHQRASINRGIRMTYHADTNILIVKVPTAKHELAHLLLSDIIHQRLREMGLPPLSMIPCGATTYDGPSGSKKEGDSSYKPRGCRVRAKDWPTLVIEAGLSESHAKLRTDAAWWLHSSSGEVKIVITILIRPAQKSISIEKWCLQPCASTAPATRANPPIAAEIQELSITSNPPIPTPADSTTTYTVTGAPLILEFENLFLRASVPPEGDVIIIAAHFQVFADIFWSEMVE